MSVDCSLQITVSLPGETYKIQWIEDNSAIQILWNDKRIAYGMKGNYPGALLSQKVVLDTVDKILADLRKHVTNALKIDGGKSTT